MDRYGQDVETDGGFTAQGHFRTVHPEDSWIAAGGAAGGHHARAREEAEFHGAAGVFCGKVEAI
jgi:hypothetical protein